MILRLVHPQQRSFLDPVGSIYDESETLVVVLIATWIMSKVERCSFANYGIPLRNALGREFLEGLIWGLVSTSLLVGLIAVFGWLQDRRSRSAWYSALVLSCGVDNCESPYRILGRAAVSRISIGDASRRCGFLAGCYFDLCRFRGPTLFS